MGARAWTEAEYAALRQLAGGGMTYGDIARELGKSPAAVQLMAGRRGISNNVQLGGRGPRIKCEGVFNRSIEVGTAAELIVCADLILAGHRAMMATAGLPYDVVLDAGGRLLRIGVKCASQPRPRSGREGGRVCYQFAIHRSSRNKSSSGAPYTVADCDLFALVALDTRDVIYVPPVGERFLTSFHVDPRDAPRVGPARNGWVRRHWSDFTLNEALRAIGVLTVAS